MNKVADAAAGLVSIPIISGVIKGVGEGVPVVMDQAEKNRMLQLRDELTQYQDWGVSQGVSDELVKRYETIIERLSEAQVRAFGSACSKVIQSHVMGSKKKPLTQPRDVINDWVSVCMGKHKKPKTSVLGQLKKGMMSVGELVLSHMDATMDDLIELGASEMSKKTITTGVEKRKKEPKYTEVNDKNGVGIG